ncbi:MAG: metallophosphoesterase [Promethearchaeota archaeon]
MKNNKLNLPNESYFKQKLQDRVGYLIEKIGDTAYRTSGAADNNTPLDSLAKKAATGTKPTDKIVIDNSDMNEHLQELEDNYNSKLQEIEENDESSQSEKQQLQKKLIIWKKNKELKLLTEQAIHDQEIAEQTSDELTTDEEQDEEWEVGKENEEQDDGGDEYEETEDTIPVDANGQIDPVYESEGTSFEDNDDANGVKNVVSGELNTTSIPQGEREDASEVNVAGKPRLKSLELTEIEKIWEFYFLHAYNHPTPDEFYGDGDAKQKILQMFQQIGDLYEKYDQGHILKEQLPGDSRICFVGDSNGCFNATDKLLRYFQSKIFESQATENPLRLVFLGNFIGGTVMDFHNLLYLVCFNILFPNEVLLFRGAHEDKAKAKRLKLDKYILEYFDKEILDAVHNFFEKLPIAYYVESAYKLIFATHGYLPINTDNPDEPINIHTQVLNNKTVDVKEMDPISQQLISNLPAMRMKEETNFSPIKGTAGFKINQRLFDPFVKENEIELMVVGNHTLKSGHRVYYDNQLVGLFSALEFKNKLIKGKLLEIHFPPDPEYFDEDYPEADEEEEDEEGEWEEGEEGEESEENEEGEESGEEEESSEAPAEKRSLFGVDDKEVTVTLLNIEDL